ncbi:SDR family oxidoreductase [Rhizobiales bacterium RZME27]|uniref:SDR family oxidoreductase n=1 Tax=Endobacterium cereale TaxID=2663029 RepID=A0A6A8AC81_9HYPH|nr:SDR family oxidoreductase [Endobacterium cereale]MEB2846343.1 SDR family oxidoreductase [Endobacterium cereale]MQY46361.1 SDR family oxidoreductase [Endobacterium cereale]
MTEGSNTNGVSRRNILTAAAVGSAATAAAAFGTAASAQASGAQPAAGAGRVAVVTGSSRGIGAATAKRLAKEGFKIAVNCRVNRDLAAAVVKEIEGAGGEAIWEQADVRDPVQVRRLFEATERAFGGVDVAVANAGVMSLAPFSTMSDEDFDTMIDTNVKGSFNTLREAANKVRDGGRIIAISSSIVQLRSPTYGPYAASKASMEIYASILAKELAGRKISVNAIAPGLVATSLFLDGKTNEQVAGFAQRTPHGRIGEPADIAATIAFLCSQDGWWVNGQTIYSNGGVI